MRVMLCVFLFVTSEARDDRPIKGPDYDDDVPSPIQREVDVLPAPFVEPVPFGHITMEGVGDPFSKYKLPIDPLELDMVVPSNSEEAIEMLKRGRKNIQFLKDIRPKLGFGSPRDKYIHETGPIPPEEKNTTLKWYRFADMQRKNAMMPPPLRGYPKKLDNKMTKMIKPPERQNHKSPFFAKNMFLLHHDVTDQMKINWTTCDEFAVKAVFSAKDIVDVEWIPFYIWSVRSLPYAILHRFRYPTKKLVADYKQKYGRLLNKTVDWNQPKLLLQGMTEMLLIAKDKRGWFEAISKHEIPESVLHDSIVLPSLTLRLKIEDPYLVMTFCEDYYATVMAISGTEPTGYNEMKAEAATIKFVGTGRPVWRDFEGEAEQARILREKEIVDQQEKTILVNDPIPSADEVN